MKMVRQEASVLVSFRMREVSPLATHILPARGLAQGVVQGFDVVGTQLLHLHRLFQADERRTDDSAAGVQQILHVEAPHKSRDAGQAQTLIICLAAYRGKTLLRQEGERTPLVPLQACAGWAKTVNCHAHPRILLPQNRCLPEPLAAPFPRQPEPRCNTLDFASKVVCQRGAASRLSARSGASKCAAF